LFDNCESCISVEVVWFIYIYIYILCVLWCFGAGYSSRKACTRACWVNMRN